MSTNRKHIAFVGLGSNLGRRDQTVIAALNAFQATRDIDVQAVSSLYETEAVGGPAGQPAFINAAAKLATGLSPQRLLSVLLAIEQSLGRARDAEVRWGPRTIDLDLLLFDHEIISTAELIVPHPLMHERRFVMAPMAEIGPDVVHPLLEATMKDILDGLE